MFVKKNKGKERDGIMGGEGRRERTGHTSRLVKRTIRLRYSRIEICGTDAEWKREMLSGESGIRSLMDIKRSSMSAMSWQRASISVSS